MKGLAGLVVKPVVGVMDFTSKTAEGIKNTANFFDDKPNEKRYRPPRVFYGTEQYYRTFKMQDSEMVELLSSTNPSPKG
jgi:vacuolar protein sorting-associated protein 13A/C